jgi:uncharacterized protein
MGRTILWRRVDKPGHEFARLTNENVRWWLAGTAVFVHEDQPCKLDYRIECNSSWQTQAARIDGWLGDHRVKLEIRVGEDSKRWWLNGAEQAQAAGCIDLDLNFSPVTNTLPIRRLGLSNGQEAAVKAAWLRFPSFRLEPLEQVYRRIDDTTYRYESAGGAFSTILKVNEMGLVVDYPGVWIVESK